jgi:hypothetical protein
MSYSITNGGTGGVTLTGGVGASGAGGFFTNTPQMRQPTSMDLSQDGINLKIVKASGGWVIQVCQLNDSVSGQYKKPELHIISDDVDFDKELGKIIMMSCLKG